MDNETFEKEEFLFKKESVNYTFEKSLNFFFKQSLKSEYRQQVHSLDLLSDIMLGSNAYSLISGLGFSINEASCELSNSLNLIFEGYYRYGYLALRNCLELVLISNYFLKLQPDNTLDNIENIKEWWEKDKLNRKYIQWLESINSTPYFSTMIKELNKLEYFELFDKNFKFLERLKILYGELSDIIHIKGKSKSSSVYEGKCAHNSTRNNIFIEERFLEYWNIRKRVVNCCIIITLLQFPIGLVGFNIEQKFGLNGPVGFLEYCDSEILRKAFSKEELAYIDEITKDDGWLIGAKEFVTSRPDITEDEYMQQWEEWEKAFNINGT